MVKMNKVLLFALSGLYITILMTSCSTSNTAKSGKYSSSGKREKSDSRTTSEIKYTYEKKAKEHKKESNNLNVSGIRLEIINTALSYL